MAYQAVGTVMVMDIAPTPRALRGYRVERCTPEAIYKDCGCLSVEVLQLRSILRLFDYGEQQEFYSHEIRNTESGGCPPCGLFFV
jgi:hypothetical protein